MGSLSNSEARITRLENLVKDDFGVSGTDKKLYPVRQLQMNEERNYKDDGSFDITVVLNWKAPAGSLIPDKIEIKISEQSVEAGGTETTYRVGGYNAGDTVKAVVYAVYSTGKSSGTTVQRTLTGDGAAPGAPSNLIAVGGFRTITLSWTSPDSPNFSHVEVWESRIYDNIESAERIAQAYGSEFVRSNCGVLETRWYWVRAVDTGGNKSEFTSSAFATTTALEMDDIPDGTIHESHLAPSLAESIERIPEIEEEAQERLESAKSVLSNEIKNLREYADEQLSSAAEAAIGALDMVKDVGDKLSDAGVYVDPDSGQVKIYGLEVLREETDVRLSNAEIRLDAHAAQISSKVTLAQVDERIAEAVFGDIGELVVSGINARIDEVEETLDAQAVAISEKASSTQVADHELRLTTAESDILGLDAAIALKASQLEVSELTQRVNSAELKIDAQNGVISQFVGQSEEDMEALSDASIQNAINGFENQKRNKESLAYAKQELKATIAEVDGKVEAEAAARLELGVQVEENSAALLEEQQVRATRDEAYGSLTTALVAQLDNDAGEAAVENAIQGYENSKALSKQSAAYFKELNTRIVAGQRSEAESREVLEASLGNALAQIEQVSKVTAGKPDVYNQPSAPSGSLKLGDLWIDNNSLIHRWTGSEWEECRDKELVELMELASAQTWLKAQVSASGRKVIAGIGVLADTTAGSEITMLADRFFLVSSVDGALIQPFAVDSTGSSPKIVINGNLFVQALKDGGYTDETGWIVGDRIAVNSRMQLSDGGELVIGDGGIIQIGDNIIIDGGNGTFFLRASDNENNHVYIGGGVVRISRDFGDVQPSVYLLSRLGTASGLTNNVVKALSGVWSEPPVVATGLTDMRTYDPSYEASQEIETDVTGLTYQTGGVYKVAAYARLVTSGGQYTWAADEILEPSEYWTDSLGHRQPGWHYSVEPPTKTYTFSWYGTVQDVQYVTARLYLSSVRNNPHAARYWYTAVFQIYFDYINQSTGATVNQLVATHSMQAPTSGSSVAEYLYLSRVQLGALASNVRVRVVVSNGSSFLLYPNSPSITHSSSSDWLRFAGGALFKSDSTEHTTIYNGTIDALAVGR